MLSNPPAPAGTETPRPLRPPAWLIWMLAPLVLVLALWAALVWWLPSDEELAGMAADKLSAALGVKVTVGAVHWRLLPVPSVTIEDLATAQAMPVTVGRLTVYPALMPLLQRRIQIERAELDGMVAPQPSLSALGAGDDANPQSSWTAADIPLKRLDFQRLKLISRTGVPVIYAGQIDFDAGWRPQQALVRAPEAATTTELQLKRQADADAWDATIALGGGSANGGIRLLTGKNGLFQLDGKLQPKGVEVAAMLQAFNRRPVLAGKASGQTTLFAEGAGVAELVRALHTRTVFSMGPSTLLHLDIDKAVRSLGKQHDGQTRLDTLTGQLDTQNSATGVALTFSSVKAKSGVLTASASGKLSNRRVDAEVAVDLVDGVVGVPVRITGPLSDVKVSVSGGAVAGAVVGTAVLPGIGTAIGARVGSAIGKLFGSDKPAAGAAPKP